MNTSPVKPCPAAGLRAVATFLEHRRRAALRQSREAADPVKAAAADEWATQLLDAIRVLLAAEDDPR